MERSLMKYLRNALVNAKDNIFDVDEFRDELHLYLLRIIDALISKGRVCDASKVSRMLDSAYYGGGAMMFIGYALSVLCTQRQTPYTIDDVRKAIERATKLIHCLQKCRYECTSEECVKRRDKCRYECFRNYG